MDISKFLVWVVAPAQNEIDFLEYHFGCTEHRDFLRKLIADKKINHYGRGESHFAFAQTLCENGYIVGINSGVKIGGRYTCTLFLPEHLSSWQLEFLEGVIPIFKEKFYTDKNMFSTLVYSTSSFGYKSGYDNFRDLEIEAKINNSSFLQSEEAGVMMLEEELGRMKNQKQKEK